MTRACFQNRGLSAAIAGALAGLLLCTNGAPYVLDSQCELVVAGVTNEVAMPIHLLPLGDGKLKLTGNVSAKMSDFGIEPPKLPLAKPEGSPIAIKYRDEIDLTVEWLVARQPASSAKDEP